MNRAGIISGVVVLTTAIGLLARTSPKLDINKVGDQITGHQTEEVMDQRIKQFFLQYEKANSSSDVSAIGSLYADTFMFAGPNSIQAIKKEDFLKVVPKMKVYFSSMGLSDSQLQTVETKPLDSKYLLATVVWRMKLSNSSGRKHVDASATYVLVRGNGDALAIVFQIDHQDLASVIDRQRHIQQ